MNQPAHPALVSYPAKAAFGRTLPKNKIYEHSGANTRLKDLFVKQVEQIVWQYKLAPETVNLSAKSAVPEVQVFAIQLKTPELNWDVLRCIDGAVQFPIVFELSFDGQTQVVACYKRLNESDASRWVLSDYFATKWLPRGSERSAMPLALDLASLYEQLLHRLMPLPARPQESLAALVARVEQAEAKRREVEKAASRLEREKQFNRKVEINATLRQLKTELEQLAR
ncbi:DUF4391 domain-containing protein [Cupriavidus sp. RAF20_2]|uniref:DUF4391 domain-containing protein n=1 Tax=Cupriavidus sp. RAF20_2 TaxID=3233053 RepID=UPI003F9254C7